MSHWLILVHRIPPRPEYLRAKMRDRLRDLGAIAVKNAVYLLPKSLDALEDLQWIVQEITAGGGDAHLFEGDFVDGVANETAIAQFREARNADYAAIIEDAREAMKSARSAAAVPSLAAAHAKLIRRFEDVVRIDFFEADQRDEAEAALASIERRLRRDKKEESRMIEAHPELRNKTWVTRPGVKIDRMASAWFILRFIDPKARFRFADPPVEKRDGELRFDMSGGDFTHEKDRCTFETLAARAGTPDKGVRAIAEIVHDLDLKDSKFQRAEAAGVRVLIDGLIARTADDEERIARALVLFDDLHEALGKRPAGQRK